MTATKEQSPYAPEEAKIQAWIDTRGAYLLAQGYSKREISKQIDEGARLLGHNQRDSTDPTNIHAVNSLSPSTAQRLIPAISLAQDVGLLGADELEKVVEIIVHGAADPNVISTLLTHLPRISKFMAEEKILQSIDSALREGTDQTTYQVSKRYHLLLPLLAEATDLRHRIEDVIIESGHESVVSAFVPSNTLSPRLLEQIAKRDSFPTVTSTTIKAQPHLDHQVIYCPGGEETHYQMLHQVNAYANGEVPWREQKNIFLRKDGVIIGSMKLTGNGQPHQIYSVMGMANVMDTKGRRVIAPAQAFALDQRSEMDVQKKYLDTMGIVDVGPLTLKPLPNCWQYENRTFKLDTLQRTQALLTGQLENNGKKQANIPITILT